MRLFAVILVTVVLSFCSCTNLMTTGEPVVADPSAQEFGFVGTWQGEPEFPREEKSYLKIDRVDDRPGWYRARSISDPKVNYQFCALQFSDDHPDYAIIQLQYRNDAEATGFVYSYAQVTDDQLFVWTIKADEVAKILQTQKINAFIERGMTYRIDADSAELLKIFREHAKTIADTPSVFTRKDDAGR